MVRVPTQSNSIRRQGSLPSLVYSVCIASVLILIFPAIAHAAKSRNLNFDIQPQRTDRALLQLAETARIQILFSPQATAETRSTGLRGTHSVKEALDATLSGTGLEYEFKSEDFIIVTAGSSAPSTTSRDEVSRQEVEEERRNGVKLARMQEPLEEEESNETAEQANEDDQLELESQVVTGSRLATGDPSARVYSYSAEEIAVRGVSTLEEFFRTLHWAFPTMTTQTNSKIVFFDADYEKFFDDVNVGVSTVNLRHMGSANTLVLVNGRRIAGLAGDLDNIVNILNMPLSAIERVDVQLDGASAVYGSDAIGGVVNFITKKNYREVSATYREEYSSTDADRRNLSVRGGYGWESGHLSAALSRQTSKPVNQLNLWTTMDWRPLFGPEFDRRSGRAGQPGVVCTYNGDYTWPRCGSPRNYRALPPDHSGMGATPEDFSDPSRSNLFWPQNGEDSTNTSLSLNLEQYITDNLRVYADVLVSRHDAYQARDSEMRNFVVPASNAYNPFGENVVVNYVPWREIESGIIQPAHQESESEQRNYTAGIFWEFGDGHQLEVSAARSESNRTSWWNWFDYSRGYHDPSADVLYDALASPDPDKALNLFGNGTVQGSVASELFDYGLGPIQAVTEITRFEPLLRGQLFRLWGGPIEYAVGAEYRRMAFTQYQHRYQEGGLQRDTRLNQGWLWDFGTDEPTREMRAYFFELSIPLIGPANDRPGLRSLILSVQARRDTAKMEGPDGGRGNNVWTREPFTYNHYVPGEGWRPITVTGRSLATTANIVEVEEGATSPRVGVQYKPIDTFTLRAAWSRSFAPPNFDDIFSMDDAREDFGWFQDPYHPDGLTGWMRYFSIFRPFGSHLNPEFSDNYSVSFDWSPERMPGLRWSLDWSMVDFTDKILSANHLLYGAAEETFKLPKFVQRDADGYITEILVGSSNIAEKRSEVVQTQLEYAFDTRVGGFISGLHYTTVLDEYFRFTPEGEKVSHLGKVRGSNKYRLTGSLSWLRGRFGADMFVYHTPGYLNDSPGRCNFPQDGRCAELGRDLPELDVDALTTVDLTLKYRFDNGLQLRAGGRNIFQAKSLTVWGNFQYDPTRWDARGRVLFLELTWDM